MTDTSPTFTHDPDTGLVPGFEYPRQPNGKIDWRACINPAHIRFNGKNKDTAAEIEKLFGGKPDDLVYAEVVKKQPVDDKYILILKAGFEELAELRGYESSVPVGICGDSSLVACGWAITWIPNSEEPLGKTSGGTADATLDNTGGWGYLGAMAGNRAFQRAVKQGLGIKAYGYDEIGKKDTPGLESGTSYVAGSAGAVSQPGQPVPTLIRICDEHKFSFQVIKESAIARWNTETEELKKNPDYVRSFVSDPSEWEGFDSISPKDCATLISRIKAHAEKERTKTASGKK